ncbi:diacylglycerol kinase family protein [Daejeonella sp. H1SJ63]|jgi:diacylglycerol kinase|uniref:diacylglycerol kinase family protein n=1 Tax=Daejeonella sp. H1SJ63 TaxID=3034145 RepID=UPI0023ED3440|nr:diacylglycerol kinase family protein [Daejeonella sp. H1SJ63]
MKKFIRGFYFAFSGLGYAFKTQRNFRVHCAAAVIVSVLSYYLNLNTSEWLWIIAAMAIVLIAELMNTSIETLVDLISPEYHVKAGIAKDVAAAMVLLSAITALIIGAIILLPKIIDAA